MNSTSLRVGAERRLFPGRAWIVVGLAFPIAGYIGWAISGPIDAVGAALVGGAVTGAGLGAVQWWAGKGAFGSARPWILASALSYAAGLAAGAALVAYRTDIADLVLMGAVTGVAVGTAQGVVLAGQGRVAFGGAWGAAMPFLLGGGWAASTVIGVSVEDQFTVFGAAGALVFTVFSGLLLASFDPTRNETS